MACLSYNPSRVKFDQKMFERNQLIEAQGYLLYLAIQQLRHLDFTVVEKTLLGHHEDVTEASVTGGDLDYEPQFREDRFAANVAGNSVDSIGQPSVDNTRQNTARQQPQFFSPAAHESEKARQNAKMMISFAKSREYAKLASQVPVVFNIEQGAKVLNTNDLRRAGISAINTKQEKYKLTLEELKRVRDPRPSFQRTAGNFTAQSLDPHSQAMPLLNKGLKTMELNLASAVGSIQNGQNQSSFANELSTPIIKNKRRFVNLTGALRDMGSTDAIQHKQFEIKARKFESL